MNFTSGRRLAALVVAALVAAACGNGSGDPGADRAAKAEEPSTAVPTTEPQVTPTPGVAVELIAQVTERVTSPEANGVAVNGVVAGTNEFAVNLFKLVADPSVNTVVGNYSLSSVLLLTMAGTAGETTSAFAEMLGVSAVDPSELHDAVNALDLILESRSGEDLQLSTANALFVQEGLPLTDEFLNIAVGSYGAPVRSVDFARNPDEIATAVNEWVAEQTDGFIDHLTDGYPTNSLVVLVNAMYLKASWAVEFRRLDETRTFETSDGTLVQTEMMAHDDFLPLNLGDDFVAVGLPYAGGNLGLVVVQPTDLTSFEADLTSNVLTEITEGLQESGIHLTMPIWATKTNFEALEPLHQLGLPNDYDFSAMFDDSDGTFIASVSHVARIEVDETGTTAAAASDAVIAGSHGPTIDINRPFFYFIRDKGSNTILFMGHVTDPTQGV